MIGGFCAEMGRNGIYISEFLYPLFDRADDLNLNLSKRLPYPGGYIDFDEVPEHSRPSVLAERIDPHVVGIKKKMSLQAAYEFILESPSLLKNEWILKTHVLLLVAMGRYSEAQTNINMILERKFTGARERITTECQAVGALLQNDPEGAKRLVFGWEEQMKAMLKI